MGRILGGIAPGPNMCITPYENDGIITWYGYEEGNFGGATPSSNVLDQSFYSMKWDAGGNFIASFGAAGDEQVPDVPQILFYYKDQTAPVILAWDGTNEYYAGIDLGLATTLIALSGSASKICFYAEIEPVLFIQYDYNLETS